MREFWSTLSPTPQGRRNPDDKIEPENLLSLLVNLTFTGEHNVSGLQKLSEHADSLFILSYVPFHVTSFTSRGEILVSAWSSSSPGSLPHTHICVLLSFLWQKSVRYITTRVIFLWRDAKTGDKPTVYAATCGTREEDPARSHLDTQPL